MACAMLLSGPDAIAQEITIEGVARSASSFTAVSKVCPKFYRVNEAEVNKWQQRRDEQEFVRWCFASVTDADDFAQQIGGERLTERPV
jgi:hypothetical protein